MNLTSAAIEAAAKAIYTEGAYCGNCEYAGWESCPDCRTCCISYAQVAAPHMCSATHTQRTEWPDIPRSQASRHNTSGLNTGVTLCLECIKDTCTEHSPNLYGPNPYRS